MKIIKTTIEDLLILEPTVYEDNRGYFMESYKETFIKEHFPDLNFIQDNESKSSYGVLRGLHFQKPPYEQTKLVRVVHGKVLDVAVDLRPNSLTFGKWESLILSDSNKKQFLIPKGFAHGFITLSKVAVFSYKVDAPYSKIHESGIRYDDPALSIDWGINKKDIMVNKKDLELKKFIFHKNVEEDFN